MQTLFVLALTAMLPPAAPLQVADHLDINRDDSDESKVASLGAVVAPGEQIWCKVVEVKEGDERWVLCRAAVFLPGITGVYSVPVCLQRLRQSVLSPLC